jgi:hypothetical protein
VVKELNLAGYHFTQCTTNGKDLASYKPGGWEGGNKSRQVTGKLSAITGGTSFTVSP